MVEAAGTTEPRPAIVRNRNDLVYRPPVAVSTVTSNDYDATDADFDAGTEEHYNYFRDYDPTIGRYVESDPIGLEGGLNVYGYVFGRPLLYVDPSGLAAKPNFDPSNNENPAWLAFNNCYSYALNRSSKSAGGYNPGDPSGNSNRWINCADLKAAAKADGAIDPEPGECGGTCPEGYHKIKLFTTDRTLRRNDYHFFRQDAGGGWSSKMGRGPARDHGKSCPVPPYFDYLIDCGALCVKN